MDVYSASAETSGECTEPVCSRQGSIHWPCWKNILLCQCFLDMLPPTQLLALGKPAASKASQSQLFYPPLLVPAPRGLCCPFTCLVERFDGTHNSWHHAVMPLGRIQLLWCCAAAATPPHRPLLLLLLLLVLPCDTLLGAFSQC